mmetsp:Transcript_100306/g.261485  ORF Transcript_100306/g.261485 Transcript_100306/m.261485 type:complete len:244 (+) Transcript_100306:494-1225(+)
MVMPSYMTSALSRSPRSAARDTSCVVCSRHCGKSSTQSAAMSRSCSKAPRTSLPDHTLPSSCETARRAASDSPISMPVARSLRTKAVCSFSERCSSSAIWASSSTSLESKNSRIASRTSSRKWRASPEPQALRECRGVCRWAARSTWTPRSPPKRSRRALLRNSAGSSSRSTAPASSATRCSAAPGWAASMPSAAPSSREKPSWMSTSSSSQFSAALCNWPSMPSTRPRFSASSPSWSKHDIQ